MLVSRVHCLEESAFPLVPLNWTVHEIFLHFSWNPLLLSFIEYVGFFYCIYDPTTEIVTKVVIIIFSEVFSEFLFKWYLGLLLKSNLSHALPMIAFLNIRSSDYSVSILSYRKRNYTCIDNCWRIVRVYSMYFKVIFGPHCVYPESSVFNAHFEIIKKAFIYTTAHFKMWLVFRCDSLPHHSWFRHCEVNCFLELSICLRKELLPSNRWRIKNPLTSSIGF